MFLGTAALFALALGLGGLGPHAPLFNGLIEAAAFSLLVAVAIFGRTEWPTRADHLGPVLFLVLMLAIGLAQLIPLPQATWATLPGREVPALVAETLGWTDRSRPLSLAPEDTRLVIQSWLPPIAIFFATAAATHEERRLLARLVVAAAALSSVVGLLQLSFGDGTFFLDPGGIAGRYPGLFANYNHQAVFLAAAVALLPAAWNGTGKRGSLWPWWPAAFWALASVGTLITSSRAGLTLFALASLVTAARMVGSRSAGRGSGRRRRALLVIGVAIAAIGFLWLIAPSSYRAELIGSRFGAVGDDARYEFWATTVEAIRTTFPYGAGFGTFEPVYQLVEPLEHVREIVVNHAHNDYLEFVLEAGAAGILLLLLFVIWFGERVIAIARRGKRDDPLAWSGVTIVLLVMLHSLVDYPLRTEAIGCTFAFACALLLAPLGDRSSRARVRAPLATRALA